MEAQSSIDVNEAIHTLNVRREQSLFSHSEHNCWCAYDYALTIESSTLVAYKYVHAVY